MAAATYDAQLAELFKCVSKERFTMSPAQKGVSANHLMSETGCKTRAADALRNACSCCRACCPAGYAPEEPSAVLSTMLVKSRVMRGCRGGGAGGGVGARVGGGGETGRSEDVVAVVRAGAGARMRCARSGGRSVSDCAIGGCGSGGDPPDGRLPVAVSGMVSGSAAGCCSGVERPAPGYGWGPQGCRRWL